jgi:nitroreductase
MDVMEAIFTRRSIREYSSQSIPGELIDTLIAAAMQAPSAGNAQPWHFIVVMDREKLTAMAEAHPYGKMLAAAPLGIVICADLNLQKHEGFWVQDCSAAVQNLLLAIHANGLGAVWIGIYPVKERIEYLNQIVKLPPSVTPLCVVAVGYPAEKKSPVDRYRQDRVHHEQW